MDTIREQTAAAGEQDPVVRACAEVIGKMIEQRKETSGIEDEELYQILNKQGEGACNMYRKAKTNLERSVNMCVDAAMLKRVEAAVYAVQHAPKEFALLAPLRAIVLDLNKVIAEHIEFRRTIQALQHDKLMLINELLKISCGDSKRHPTFGAPMTNFAGRVPEVSPKVTLSVGLS